MNIDMWESDLRALGASPEMVQELLVRVDGEEEEVMKTCEYFDYLRVVFRELMLTVAGGDQVSDGYDNVWVLRPFVLLETI